MLLALDLLKAAELIKVAFQDPTLQDYEPVNS